MDQFLSWLDTSGFFTTIAHSWPWSLATASLALIALVGISSVARRYRRSETSDTFHQTVD